MQRPSPPQPSLKPQVFSNSFYGQLKQTQSSNSLRHRKDHLISVIADKIYAKNRNVLTLSKVQEFTTHVLKDKQVIEPADLSLIEKKLEVAFKQGSEARYSSTKRPKNHSMTQQNFAPLHALHRDQSPFRTNHEQSVSQLKRKKQQRENSSQLPLISSGSTNPNNYEEEQPVHSRSFASKPKVRKSDLATPSGTIARLRMAQATPDPMLISDQLVTQT